VQQFGQNLQEAREIGISISLSPSVPGTLVTQLAKAGCITFAIQVSEHLRPNESVTYIACVYYVSYGSDFYLGCDSSFQELVTGSQCSAHAF